VSILARLDAAFERAGWRYPESSVRWIYLDEQDWRDFDAAIREEWPSVAHCFSYRDVQIRKGNRSRLSTKGGCLVCVPKRLSPRIAVAA
jgi:hypothetical protein